MILSSMAKNGAILTAFALVTTGLVASINMLTADKIAEQELLHLTSQLQEVLDPSTYDNELTTDCVIISDERLGPYANQIVYRARKNNEPVALIVRHVTPSGYSGDINLLTAVLSDGSIAGVRTTKHEETPGLGDKVEVKKSPWITSFKTLTVQSSSDARWAVKKDGGQFDQFTGATITPRAVVGSVKNAVLFAQSEFDAIFAAPNAQCVEVTK
ncbi:MULTISPECIES: electron transport complex subunit RsxG [Pseudoalteromonas]|uniref:Ion-translocating oxidoreductase complex subunit G n=1 Tax=Pseudoalteromonas translucida (strain TAC 125) TaxID=326442 RepID=Q3IKE2_PSET1|nr:MULTISPECIES: electron transport complex subunit RsxG [Pseudoalteromonas]MBB1369885.1 electron transport complex subunit RsxG [Pseudoalteromonas sp. SR45-4]MBH0073424.1 electron transport complex subunit RsxG [Pseudoalteromonas sp. NZS127]MBH0094521.1 electron transport complex subunit RsxG [Pseudoalteromonas sp. SCQQ13]MBO7926958.1 electron transport complex subunit RsxG [Pseudoalteromonas sp. K222D]PCC12543.1 electron transport complex subunit RsxG [Pseudoalteromonas sp. JB197]